MKKRPSGFVARCQCEVITGALDAERMDNKDVGKMLGEWLMSGCSVEPRYGTWSEHVGKCECEDEPMDDATRYALGAR